jgi:cellulose synthase/poly-beta-1,6-N-acetylglucosamine synthase-like glycosyltransferase
LHISTFDFATLTAPFRRALQGATILNRADCLAELFWRLTLIVSTASLSIIAVDLVQKSSGSMAQTADRLLWWPWICIQALALLFALAHAFDNFRSIKSINRSFAIETIKVSIHVPIHREPPEIVSATLRSLSRLESVQFEVIVIDNNTPEEALWRPIEALAAQLGFKFFHLERWPGYKAGALNFARTVTSTDATLIAVVDADYVVQPDFLSRLVSHFCSPEIAFVQAPQDYRSEAATAYDRWTFFAYRHFFDVNMASHSRLGSTIFVGTMGIIRKSVLEECGDWDERCLTEDSEMALRVATKGYVGTFVNTSCGKGVMPLDYLSFRRQRYRWALGGVQIFRKYWSNVFWIPRDPRCRALTISQRLGFALFLLYWFEPFITLLTLMLFWITAILLYVVPDASTTSVLENFAALALGIFSARVLVFVSSLMRRSQCSFVEACGASIVLGSVAWLVCCAGAKALWSGSEVFERTPKDKRNDERLIEKLASIKVELVMSACLGTTATLLFAAGTQIAMLYGAGCLLGCAILALPFLVLLVDHVQWPIERPSGFY